MFSIVILYSILFCTCLSLTCIEYNNPLNTTQNIQIDCSPVEQRSVLAMSTTTNHTASSTLTFMGFDSPVGEILKEPPLDPPSSTVLYPNMFIFDVTCPLSSSSASASSASASALSSSSSSSSSKLSSTSIPIDNQNTNHVDCSSVRATMEAAGQQISNVLALTVPITVNVTFSPFCQTLGLCNDQSQSNVLALAAAAPARTIPLLDDDGVTRLYPQSVVKQFSYIQTPQYGPIDIILNINSEALFYYPVKGGKISSMQTDFLMVVMHELMHGLGFTSAWEDYIHPTAPSTLTPNILLNYINRQQSVGFGGFIEYAFDRYMAFSPTQLVTNTTAKMNNLFFNDTANRTFGDVTALTDLFTQNPSLSGLAASLLTNFTKPHSTYFVKPADDSVTLLTLETSLSPFSAGSSISHVSSDLYEGTADFLMRYISQKGISMTQYMATARSNGGSDVELYGAMGPGLRGALAGLGYRVRGGIPKSPTIARTLGNAKSIQSSAGHTISFPRSGWLFLLCLFVPYGTSI